MVRKGAWTLDTVRGIVKDFWFDNPTGGTVGGLDESDTFGLISAGTQWTDLTAASCGIRFVRNDGGSTPEITAFPTFAQVVTALNALGSSRGFFLPKDRPAAAVFGFFARPFCKKADPLRRSALFPNPRVASSVRPHPLLRHSAALFPFPRALPATPSPPHRHSALQE